MTATEALDRYYRWQDDKSPVINTLANHLIVMFAFSVPVLVEVRRTSLVLLIVLFLVRGRIYQHIRNALRDPVVLAFSLYFVVHLIWMIGTDDRKRVGEAIHDAAFLLIPLLFSTFIDRRFVARILAAFFTGMSISVLLSFGIFFEILPAMIHDGDQGDWRDPTPLYHHTHYGYMLAMTCVIMLGKSLAAKQWGMVEVVSVFLLAGAAANIFIIAGRSGFVLLVILVPVLFLLMYGKKALAPFLVMVLVISAATFFAYNKSPTFSNRVDTTLDSIEKIIHERDYYSSLGGRAAIAMISLDLASDHWLLGMGTADHTGQIQETIKQDYAELWFLARGLAHPHNEYINALLQFGILGLLLFLNIPLQLLRYKNENKESEIIFKLIGVSIIFYVMQDVFVIDLGMLFTVVVLVSAGLREYSTTNAEYKAINIRQVGGYTLAMATFYLLKQI